MPSRTLTPVHSPPPKPRLSRAHFLHLDAAARAEKIEQKHSDAKQALKQLLSCHTQVSDVETEGGQLVLSSRGWGQGPGYRTDAANAAHAGSSGCGRNDLPSHSASGVAPPV
eukprot:5526389-Pyramimonas_sp.AAC.1